jgi:L-fuculose-phosphate aldolase
MLETKLIVGTWGNVSVRISGEEPVAITPSGVEYDKIALQDVVIIDMKGNVVDGHLRPSIEVPLHLAVKCKKR